MGVSKVIGLDVGSDSVKMVEIDRSKKGFELEFVGLATLPEGAIVEKSIKKAELVKQAIKNLWNYTGRGKNVCISISGKSVIVKQVTMNTMTDAQLEKQIQIEAEPYIPFDIKDVNLDFYITGEKPEKEGSMDVVLVAAKTEAMSEYMDLLKQLGLVPVVVDVDPFSLEVMYDYCYPTVEEEIVALVNVGATTININILHNACSKYTRDLPVGGYTITKEIMRFFDVDYRQAENIKRGAQIDSKITPRNLRKIFQRAVDNFVSEIQKIFDFFSTNISYDPIQKIFLSGGAAATYGLESALASELSIPVEIVNPFRNLKVNPKMFDQMYLEEIGPQMAVAVGLALRDERDKEGPWSR